MSQFVHTPPVATVRHGRWRRPWIVALAIFVCAATTAGFAASPVPWELRVCADPANEPVSMEDGSGFENRIAEILADEMGATLAYVWTPINDLAVKNHLRTGDCDLIMSVAESSLQMLNTVAYYRVPFSFVWRTVDDLAPADLLDPSLADLRIGVPPNGLLNLVLYDVGLADAFVGIGIDRSERGLARSQPLVDALVAGEVDVVMMESTVAAMHVARSVGALQTSVAGPELVPPFTPLFRVATLGVRAHDEAFRDALNVALANRWDDVAAVFADMGIPTLFQPPPFPPRPRENPPLRIGFVGPLPTGTHVLTDPEAEAARFGARVGDETVSRADDRRETPLEVVYASAPTAAAAARAAARLLATSAVDVLVGGIGDGQASAIAEVARAAGVPFLNVGDGSDALRADACVAGTFHVAPSDAIYADALAGAFAPGTLRVVVAPGERRSAVATRVESAWTSAGGTVLPALEVDAGPSNHRATLLEMLDAPADLTVLVLAADDLEMFLVQASLERIEGHLVPFPFETVQTRDFYERLRSVAPDYAERLRIAGWDPTIVPFGAAAIAERFASRSGQPMDPSGWATYAAIEIVADAYARSASRDPADLIAALWAGTGYDVLKGSSISFRPWDGQLRQPVYTVRIDADAPWAEGVSARIALAAVEGTLPAVAAGGTATVEDLDAYGDGPSTRDAVPGGGCNP